MFVKFVDENTIVKASRLILHDGEYYANPTEETLLDLGFLSLVVDQQPKIEENQYLIPKYAVEEIVEKSEKEDGEDKIYNAVVNHWEIQTVESSETEGTENE